MLATPTVAVGGERLLPRNRNSRSQEHLAPDRVSASSAPPYASPARRTPGQFFMPLYGFHQDVLPGPHWASRSPTRASSCPFPLNRVLSQPGCGAGRLTGTEMQTPWPRTALNSPVAVWMRHLLESSLFLRRWRQALGRPSGRSPPLAESQAFLSCPERGRFCRTTSALDASPGRKFPFSAR